MARHKNINWNLDDSRAPRNCGPPNPENNSSAIRDCGAAANESRLAGPTHGVSGVRAVAAWKGAQDVLDVSTFEPYADRDNATSRRDRLHSRIAFPDWGIVQW